jgi:hypothetical protein
MPTEYSYPLLFACQACGWWIASALSSPVPVSTEELNGAVFELKCPSKNCDWAGSAKGDKAISQLSSPANANAQQR